MGKSQYTSQLKSVRFQWYIVLLWDKMCKDRESFGDLVLNAVKLKEICTATYKNVTSSSKIEYSS